MDLIVFSIILVSVGLMKMDGIRKVTIQDKVSKTDKLSEGTIQTIDLPIGSNLRLYKEQDAYTLILQQFGLKR